MSHRRHRCARRYFPAAESLEPIKLPSFGLFAPTSIVYSDPTAPPEPHPGPYPGEDSPPGYPTPVPGGPVGPGVLGR